MAAKNSAARPRKRHHEAPWSLALVSAVSTVSNAPARTSQNRNSRMPTATALRKAFSASDGLRMRPIGSPRKMVNPAMAPRIRTSPSDIGAAPR